MALTRKSIRKAIAELKNEKFAIATKDGDLTDADRSRVDEIDAKVADHEERLSLLEDSTSADAADSKDYDDEEMSAGKSFKIETRHTVPATPIKSAADNSNGLPLARFVMGKAMVREMGLQGAADFMERRFNDGHVAKALVSNTTSGGGALIPQNFMPDLIELLRAATVFREAGPMVFRSDTANATMGRLSGGATAGYGVELAAINASQQTFDNVNFTAKKLTAMVPVSNDLIRRAVIGIDAIVRDDLVASVARRQDLAFLTGSGTVNDPVGLTTIAAAAGLVITAPTVTQGDTTGASLQSALNLFYNMQLQLKLGASRMLRPTWFANPVVGAFLRTITDKVGYTVFRDELDAGRLLGYPYKESIQLPDNLNLGSESDSKGTQLILIDMADAMIMDSLNASVDVSVDATYVSGGNTYSAFQSDMTIMRIICEHDMQLRHNQSLVVANLDNWTPTGFTAFGPGVPYTTQPQNAVPSSAPSTRII